MATRLHAPVGNKQSQKNICKMEKNDIKNWLKLNILLDRACATFRQLFTNKWKENFGEEWSDAGSNIKKLVSQKLLKNIGTIQRKAISTGVVENWDLTTICTILNTDLLSLSNDTKCKLHQVVNIRNKVAHSADNGIADGEFDGNWREISGILVEFGESEEDLELLRQEDCVGGVKFLRKADPINEENATKARQLKEAGNLEFGKDNWETAGDMYTKALLLNDIPVVDKAVLHTNRSIALLKQKKLSEALKDAKIAIKLRPEWWRSHFRLGQVYSEMKKFEKAHESLLKAFAIEPQQKEVTDELSFVRLKLGQLDRDELMDSRNIQQSTQDCLSYFENLTGISLPMELQNKVETSNIPEFKNLADCRRGHRCRGGLDGFPRDYKLAAEYYKKAADRGGAEGLYNLAVLVIEGKGIKRDIQYGITLLKKAADMPPFIFNGSPNIGVAEAEHKLGLHYDEGVGVDKDLIEAIKWYERSCEHGCPNAANNLGCIYEGMGYDVKAVQYFKLAAHHGDPNAMFSLAEANLREGDYEMALEWCGRAKRAGLIRVELEQVEQVCRREISSVGNGGMHNWKSAIGKNIKGVNSLQEILQFLNGRIPNVSSVMPMNPEYVQKYSGSSEYCKKLWQAQKHFLAAISAMIQLGEKITKSSSLCKIFIEEFSAGAKIEKLMAQLPLDKHQRACAIVNRLLAQNHPLQEELYVCYASLNGLQAKAHTVVFLTECISKYPNNPYFVNCRCCLYGFLKKYEDGLRDANTAIKLDPSNYCYLYDRAAMMRLYYPYVATESIIKTYEEFLNKAPFDHRKVPEAYYAMASVLICQEENYKNPNIKPDLEMASAKHYYELGVKAEKRQLPFFLPYDSKTKALVENMLILYDAADVAGGHQLPMNLKEINSPEPTSNLIAGNTDGNILGPQLSDPYRDLLTKDIRNRIDLTSSITSNYAGIAFTWKPPKVQKSSRILAGLKATTLQQMDHRKDHIYEGCVLLVTVIDDVAFTGSSWHVIIEDTAGDVERCFLYNWKNMDTCEARENFGPGCKMSIINPYMRMAADMKPLIRVDDTSSIVSHGFIEKMCRYCCRADASKCCVKCRVPYCDKICQKLDWRRNHKMICCR